MLQNNKWILTYVIAIFLIVAVMQKYRFMFNVTHSLPQKMFFINVGNKKLGKGDFVITQKKDLPNIPHGFAIIKKIAGVGTNVVTLRNNHLYIDNDYCCAVESLVVKWGILHPLTESTIIIPKDCFFVRGTSSDSFDSRFKEFGFVCESQILGKAYPLF